MYKTTAACTNVVKHYESLHDGDLRAIGLQPKLCPAGVWTIGYGHALVDSQGRFLRGQADRTKAYQLAPALSIAQAEVILKSDLQLFGKRIMPGIKTDLQQHQFDALVSLAFNIGHAAFLKSTLLKVVNANPGDPTLDKHFLSWRFATVGGEKEELEGLIARRKTEWWLYKTGKVLYFN